MGQTSYDADFYAWANEQAGLLRAGRLAEADVANIAEEIATLGRSEYRELVNRLGVLLTHLAKWTYQPERRSRSWGLTIQEQRIRLVQHLRDNPSLKARVAEGLADGWDLARLAAERETGLPRITFPELCPWTLDRALTEDVLTN